MKVELYVKVYHKMYPEVSDELLEIDEMIDCVDFDDAKCRLETLMSVLMPIVYPGCLSTSYVRIPNGEIWTYTDVM